MAEQRPPLEPTLQGRMAPLPTSPTVVHPASTILGQRLDQQAVVAEQAGLPLPATPPAAGPASRPVEHSTQPREATGGRWLYIAAALTGAAAAALWRACG
jgi:hypothetical protein